VLRPIARLARALLLETAEVSSMQGSGFSLIEATIALGLTATIAVSVSTAIVASRAAGVRARDTAIAVMAARSRLAELAALRFDVALGADGVTVAGTDVRLAPSPGDSLSTDRAGLVDYLDGAGVVIGADAAAATRAAYVRRWAIGRQGSEPGDVALLAVLVAPIAVDRRVRAGADPARLLDHADVVVVRGALPRHAS
jgi:type II secretory pathway pseudopilin PulG